MSVADRVSRLAEVVAERELAGLLVGGLIRPGDSSPMEMLNLRWLTGFTGTSGAVVVGPEQPVFVTDFRYAERLQRDLGDVFEIVVAERQMLPALASRLEGRIGYDESAITVRIFGRLEEELAEGAELVSAPGIVEKLRRTKDDAELDAIGAAAELADQVFNDLAGRGLAGRTELDVARFAQARMRELGAEPSFPPIVATAENGAQPHSEPSDRVIGAGELVVVDMGAMLEGYCSDCTRTYATGELDAEAMAVYELVRTAQAAALEAVGPGVSGADVDEVARNLITAAGHGDHFQHGTGHGVGVEVHEAPRLGMQSEDVLEAGDVVTVEPGVYLPGKLGVRIEDLVAVTEDGYRNFIGLPKQLQIVG